MELLAALVQFMIRRTRVKSHLITRWKIVNFSSIQKFDYIGKLIFIPYSSFFFNMWH